MKATVLKTFETASNCNRLEWKATEYFGTENVFEHISTNGSAHEWNAEILMLFTVGFRVSYFHGIFVCTESIGNCLVSRRHMHLLYNIFAMNPSNSKLIDNLQKLKSWSESILGNAKCNSNSECSIKMRNKHLMNIARVHTMIQSLNERNMIS